MLTRTHLVDGKRTGYEFMRIVLLRDIIFEKNIRGEYIKSAIVNIL